MYIHLDLFLVNSLQQEVILWKGGGDIQAQVLIKINHLSFHIKTCIYRTLKNVTVYAHQLYKKIITGLYCNLQNLRNKIQQKKTNKKFILLSFCIMTCIHTILCHVPAVNLTGDDKIM